MAISYEEFKGELCAKLLSYLGTGYEDYEIQFHKVKKINRVLDGFSVLKKADDDSNECIIAPTLYAEDFYEDYLLSEDLDEVLSEIAKTLNFGFRVADVNLGSFSNVVNSLDKIIIELINTRRNSALLEDIPHRNFLDLSIVYRTIIGDDECGISSALLNKSVFKTLEISEEELFDLAFENTQRLFPFEFKSMDEIVVNMMKRDGEYTPQVDEKIASIPDEKKLYVISNKNAFCGANALLYSDFLNEVAEKLDSDFYILPVSINELMILKVSSENKLPDLIKMIQSCNNSSNDISDVLSDNIYKFSRKSRKVTIPYAIK